MICELICQAILRATQDSGTPAGALTLVPQMTTDNFLLPLESFMITREAKNGCGGRVKVCK